jgi:ATP-binding cassette subfamily B protein/subfamily B ATP-binding cassette protein MsbA
VGDAVRRVTSDCGCAAVIVRDALLPLLGAVVGLAATFAVMWRLDPVLTLLALAVVPCMALALRIHAGPMLERSYEHQEAEARVYEVVEGTLVALPTVQAFGGEAREDARLAASTDAVLQTVVRATDVQLRFRIVVGALTALGTAGILWVGARHTLEGRLTLGTTLVFLSYLASLYAPIETLMYASSTVQDAAGSARRVLEALAGTRRWATRPGRGCGHRAGPGRWCSRASRRATRPVAPCCTASRSRWPPARRWRSWAPRGRARARWPRWCRASSTRGPGACCSTARTCAR